MSNYFNEAGEPLMDGAAMRYEMYLDSLYEPDPNEFYWSGDAYPSEAPCESDQSVCTGGDLDYLDPEHGECSWCGRVWAHAWEGV